MERVCLICTQPDQYWQIKKKIFHSTGQTLKQARITVIYIYIHKLYSKSLKIVPNDKKEHISFFYYINMYFS